MHKFSNKHKCSIELQTLKLPRYLPLRKVAVIGWASAKLKIMILSFELTMPNVGSWNGQWTGQSSKYYRHRNVSKQEAEKILAGKERNSWYYNFGDGWGASVSVVKVLAGEKNKRERISKGFAGYDWMIVEILKYGRILELQERQEMRKQETINGVPVVSV